LVDAGEISFVVDTMLGDVARWLRLMGYDALYSRNYQDWQILRVAEKGRRTIVTRDRGLYNKARRRGLSAVLIESYGMPERLAELALKTRIILRADPDRSRCTECNGELVRVEDKSVVRDRVPPGALEAHKVFYVCSRCGRVYWKGGHWRNIERIITEAKKLIKAGAVGRR